MSSNASFCSETGEISKTGQNIEMEPASFSNDASRANVCRSASSEIDNQIHEGAELGLDPGVEISYLEQLQSSYDPSHKDEIREIAQPSDLERFDKLLRESSVSEKLGDPEPNEDSDMGDIFHADIEGGIKVEPEELLTETRAGRTKREDVNSISKQLPRLDASSFANHLYAIHTKQQQEAANASGEQCVQHGTFESNQIPKSTLRTRTYPCTNDCPYQESINAAEEDIDENEEIFAFRHNKKREYRPQIFSRSIPSVTNHHILFIPARMSHPLTYIASLSALDNMRSTLCYHYTQSLNRMLLRTPSLKLLQIFPKLVQDDITAANCNDGNSTSSQVGQSPLILLISFLENGLQAVSNSMNYASYQATKQSSPQYFAYLRDMGFLNNRIALGDRSGKVSEDTFLPPNQWNYIIRMFMCSFLGGELVEMIANTWQEDSKVLKELHRCIGRLLRDFKSCGDDFRI